MDEISGDLVAVLGAALNEMIGDPKDPETLIAAIKQNVRRFEQEKGLRIMVSTKDLGKIEAAWNNARADLSQVTLSADDTLEDGRCVLAVGNRRFEIGLDAQIRAFEAEAAKAFRDAVGRNVA